MTNIQEHLIRHKCDEGFQPIAPEDSLETLPGSKGRVKEYRDRVAKGQEIWGRMDRRSYDDECED